MKKSDLKKQVSAAIQACLEKKAEELSILEMEKGSGAFTDYFVLCSGTNPRQVQAIADEVELRLKAAGIRPNNVEGYKQAEWVLLDYVDFVVHVFSEKARKFYDLERLWKSAKHLQPADLKAASRKRKVVTMPAPKKEKGRRRGAKAQTFFSCLYAALKGRFSTAVQTSDLEDQDCMDREDEGSRNPIPHRRISQTHLAICSGGRCCTAR